MSFDREDFMKSQRPPPQTVKERIRTFQAVEQAAVKIDLLTGDENWDALLSYLMARVENSKNELNGYMRQLASPDLINADEVSKRRIALMLVNHRIATLEWVMSIPAILKTGSDKAKKELKALAELEDKKIEAA